MSYLIIVIVNINIIKI